MRRNSDLISRRTAVYRALLAVGGFALPFISGSSLAAEPDFTPENVLGPFYPLDKPLDKNSDLIASGRSYALISTAARGWANVFAEVDGIRIYQPVAASYLKELKG